MQNVNDIFETNEKLERQSRLFTPFQQQQIAHQDIVIVGLGALGQMVVEQLARCGFSHFTLIDDDRVSYSNFNRQLYATTKTLDQLKVEVAKQKILAIEPLCKVKTYAIKLDETTPLDFISDTSILVDCCDNVPSKLYLEDICNQKHIPLIHGAIDGWYGQVATILPQDNLLHRLYQNQELQTHDALVVTVSLIASFQVIEIIQMTIHHTTNLYPKTLWIDALNQEFEKIKL